MPKATARISSTRREQYTFEGEPNGWQIDRIDYRLKQNPPHKWKITDRHLPSKNFLWFVFRIESFGSIFVWQQIVFVFLDHCSVCAISTGFTLRKWLCRPIDHALSPFTLVPRIGWKWSFRLISFVLSRSECFLSKKLCHNFDRETAKISERNWPTNVNFVFFFIFLMYFNVRKG